MRRLELDPLPAARLDSLYDSDPATAARLDECLDWIEADPVDVRAKRVQFTNGMKAIRRTVSGREWLILWDEDEPGLPVVRFLDESSAL